MLIDDIVISPKKFDSGELHRKVASDSVLLVKTKVISVKSNLQNICLRFIHRNIKIYRRQVRELPPQLQQFIHDHRDADEIVPIPIDFRIRALARKDNHRVADSPRMATLIKPGASDWAQRTWRLMPASPSYFAIWRACADVLQPSKPELPRHTRADFWMVPLPGPAAFFRRYVEACRRGDKSFPLVFDHLWSIYATVIADGPYGQGPLRMGAGWC